MRIHFVCARYSTLFRAGRIVSNSLSDRSEPTDQSYETNSVNADDLLPEGLRDDVCRRDIGDLSLFFVSRSDCSSASDRRRRYSEPFAYRIFMARRQVAGKLGPAHRRTSLAGTESGPDDRT